MVLNCDPFGTEYRNIRHRVGLELITGNIMVSKNITAKLYGDDILSQRKYKSQKRSGKK